jgi:hypothetical protein
MAGKRRTSVLVDETLLKRARKTLRASSNTEAIVKALEAAVRNKEITASLHELFRKGRGRFADRSR